MMADALMKTCTMCDKVYPATTEYFYAAGNRGVSSRCKVCAAKVKHEYEVENREKVNARRREVYKQKQESGADEKRRAYIEANKPRMAIKRRKRYEANREKEKEQSRQFYLVNRAELTERNQQYAKARPDIFRIKTAKRKARKLQLPDTFTPEQWVQCLEYFNYTCAVCDRQLRDLFGHIKPHADHWIAVSNPNCPGTTPDNMVCLCSECNLSKGAKLPDVWLKSKYPTRKANIILARVNAYFAWVLSQKESAA
jgi:5-methylcytosine-specific restriction endonuclease McrA